ncbi:flagellar hook-associated protein FlgK [bacterium]|nr:MAG: flagellar hook-associated protein FlgK [bacterium]
MSDMNLSIAASGIAADTAELDAASNNLSNVSTPGYAAEQVNLSPEAAGGPLGTGQGVVIESVSRLTDAVYMAANISALGVQGAAKQTDQVLKSIESIFPEPSNAGIASQLSAFWTDISTLASNPNQIGAQQAVVSAAETVAGSINSGYNQMNQLSSSLQSEIGTGANDGGALAQANALLSQVAHLNASIVAGSAGGQDVNALMDQSNAAVNKLAALLGVSAVTAANGSVTVYLNGVQLVAGNSAQSLKSTGSAATTNLGIATSNGVAVDAGGTVGANLTALNSTIPSYVDHLNSVADSLATSLNTLQANGMDAKGDPGSAIAGSGWTGTVLPNIFVDNGSPGIYTPSPPGFDSAATIAVSPELLANPSLIATASAPGAGNSNVIGTPTLDGTNAQAMAAVASSPAGPDSNYQTMIGALGTEASNASAVSSTASNLASTAASNLSSISGVNVNNEELDILAAQNAFQAVSRVVSALTTSFQTLLQAV